MTSHVHLIISADEGYDLSFIIRYFKSYTSTQLKESIKQNPKESRKNWLMWMPACRHGRFERTGKKNKRNSSFQLWQQHNHPIELNTNEMMDQLLNYIHNNPVEAGFINDPSTWIWSSCASYESDTPGLIDLIYIE